MNGELTLVFVWANEGYVVQRAVRAVFLDQIPDAHLTAVKAVLGRAIDSGALGPFGLLKRDAHSSLSLMPVS